MGRSEVKVGLGRRLGKRKGAKGEVLVSLFQGWAGALVCCLRDQILERQARVTCRQEGLPLQTLQVGLLLRQLESA